MYAIFILILLFQATTALIGYYCESQLLNAKTISLLQVIEFVETKAIQCELEINRTIYHCVMYSHISVVKNG